MLPCSLPSAQYTAHKQAIDDAIHRVLDRGIYILGPEVDAFEREFSSYLDLQHGVGVNSGTDAITLTLKAMGIGHGDEVVTSSLTAVATVAAIELAGAIPVLVDVERHTRTIDPTALEAAISQRTRAVVVVHLYGQAADLDRILPIARRHGIRVIEDCAQCAGATLQGRRLGSFGDAGCFSFYPTKNLGGIGDGGMVATNDGDLARATRQLREYGWTESRISNMEGGQNSRLDEIQAAILRIKLPHLDADNARRRALAEAYDAALMPLGISPPHRRAEADHVFHLYVVEVPNRERALAALKARGILGGIHYAAPAHRHPVHANRLATPGGMAVTNILVERILTLPLFPEMDPKVVEMVRAGLAESLG